MSLRRVSTLDVAAEPGRFDCIIDARSPSEFAEDRLPGAINLPVLDDDERRIVGTLYKQESALAARKTGAAMAARRIAAHVEQQLADKPRDWQPLVYCWRGGQRSGSLAWFLSEIGFRTAQLEGGYKAFRGLVLDQLQTLPGPLHFVVLAGRTGSGKTRLLQHLAQAGQQVLDLEGLARHRGSILGAMPGQPQPSQKHFDTLLWQALQRFDAKRPVFVESESARIGQLRVPESLLVRMREHGQVMQVVMPDTGRIGLLLQDYAFFADDVDAFCALLQSLVPLQGRERVQSWQTQARAGQWAELFGRLMAEHYDPLYDRSMRRHYDTLAAAPQVAVADGSPQAMGAGVATLLTLMAKPPYAT
jgi:tRNA 2-selenouridine synthase